VSVGQELTYENSWPTLVLSYQVERENLMLLNELIDERYDTDESTQSTRYGNLHLPPMKVGLSRKEKSFLDLAVRMAEASDVDNRHGAVIVKNGSVRALGINKWRNKGLTQTDDTWQPILTTHAEIDALARVSDAHGAVVYIARVDEKGNRKLSRPCWRCMNALYAAGVKRVVYTVN
jgi:tRNA(Arg) A34 adenosine deaminase TadA